MALVLILHSHQAKLFSFKKIQSVLLDRHIHLNGMKRKQTIQNKTAQKKKERTTKKSKKAQKNDMILNQDYLGVSKENPLS